MKMFLNNTPWEQIVRNYHRANSEGAAIDEEEEEEGEDGDVNSDVEDEEFAEDADGEDEGSKSVSEVKLPTTSQSQHLKKKKSTPSSSASMRQRLLNISVKKAPLDEEALTVLINRVANEKYPVIEPSTFDAELKALVPNLRILEPNTHLISLQTVIRNRNVPREDFVFTADRLIRLVIEEGLNLLPFNTKSVITPTGGHYEGVEYLKSNCGVSIVRSGEAMEKGLRDCCRSIRIGKVLIQSDEETHTARVVYAKLPPDISLRKVLLLYPIMSTGNTVVKAIKVLKKNGVKECNIILVNLFTTPQAIRALASRFQELTIQTSEVHPIVPHHFGQKYFGTD